MLGEIKVFKYIQLMGVKFPGKKFKNKCIFFIFNNILTFKRYLIISIFFILLLLNKSIVYIDFIDSINGKFSNRRQFE